jgi:hypothetical protein
MLCVMRKHEQLTEPLGEYADQHCARPSCCALQGKPGVEERSHEKFTSVGVVVLSAEEHLELGHSAVCATLPPHKTAQQASRTAGHQYAHPLHSTRAAENFLQRRDERAVADHHVIRTPTDCFNKARPLSPPPSTDPSLDTRRHHKKTSSFPIHSTHRAEKLQRMAQDSGRVPGLCEEYALAALPPCSAHCCYLELRLSCMASGVRKLHWHSELLPHDKWSMM